MLKIRAVYKYKIHAKNTITYSCKLIPVCTALYKRVTDDKNLLAFSSVICKLCNRLALYFVP